MKKIIVIISIFISLAACKKELKELYPPSSKVDGIKASWELSSCSMIDELSLVKEATTMGDFFTVNPSNKKPNIKFDIVSGVRTYTVDTANVLINFFENPTGTWTFDNDEYPTEVVFTPTVGTVFSLPLGASIRTVDTYLKFKKPVYCSGELKFSYVLEFKRK
jgi:hypothetical protein